MVEKKFPEVKLISNKENAGFSKANNQAIMMSKGEYVLLLNPDTIVQEDTFRKTVDFLDSHPEAGGLGVKMIDGNGIFLPESKRGLPTPLVSFYKIFGLSKLFPKSRKFGQYHLNYLDFNSTHQVDVLSGAFMMLRKKTLEKTGLLDEDFFMYGEDIDLSYRITQAGYKNYYFADTAIIHYKGESTKKNSVNYVLIFYNAMEIFFRKHFRSKLTGFFSVGVKMAIYLRAGLAILKRFFLKIFIPSLDAVVIWLFFLIALPFWENFRFGDSGQYPLSYLSIAVPIYIIVWITTIIYSGGYDKTFKFSRLWKGIFIGSASILLFYSLLPEEYRYSRAMIVFATIYASLGLPLLRLLYRKIRINGYYSEIHKNIRIAIVGHPKEVENTLPIIQVNFPNLSYIGYINNNQDDAKKLGTVEDLPDIISIHKIDEIVFCSLSLNISEIIDAMILLQLSGVKFKIATQDGVSVISSSSILTNAELFEIELNAISTPSNKRFKRTFDVVFSIFLLIFSLIVIFTVKSPGQLIINIFSVLFGEKTWVGFSKNSNISLPKLRKGVLNPVMIYKKGAISEIVTDRVNRLYAKDYKLLNDISIVLRCWRYLGNSLQEKI